MNRLKAGLEQNLMDEKAKNETLQREIQRLEAENTMMKQQLQVLMAENKENGLKEEEITEDEVPSMENQIVKPQKEKKFDKAKLCITGLPSDFTVNDVVDGLFERSNGIAQCGGRPVVSLRVTDDNKLFCIAYFNSIKSAKKASLKCSFHLKEKSLADATVDFLEVTEENEDLICDPVKIEEESALNCETLIENSAVKDETRNTVDETQNATVDDFQSMLNKMEMHINATKSLNKRKLFISGLPRGYRENHIRKELFNEIELVTQNDKPQLFLKDTGVAQNCVVELKNEIDAKNSCKKMCNRLGTQSSSRAQTSDICKGKIGLKGLQFYIVIVGNKGRGRLLLSLVDSMITVHDAGQGDITKREEAEREIFRLNEELKKHQKSAGKTNEKAFEGLVELLEQKLNGQRMECPSCEPDGPPPILGKLWICTEHFEAKHKKSITEVPFDKIEEIVKQEALCADCIQHSHRRCQKDMTNLLEVKKLSKCEKMRQFLEMIKWKERIGERVPKTSAESAEERIRKKIDDLMQGTLRAADVDEKVERLVESLKRFAQATADMEAQMEETMRNMIMIENDAQTA